MIGTDHLIILLLILIVFFFFVSLLINLHNFYSHVWGFNLYADDAAKVFTIS